MLSEGKGTAAADAVRYVLTEFHIQELVRLVIDFKQQDDYLSERGKNDRYEPALDALCQWQNEIRKIKVPPEATHFYRARQGDDDESWGVLGEIPQ